MCYINLVMQINPSVDILYIYIYIIYEKDCRLELSEFELFSDFKLEVRKSCVYMRKNCDKVFFP